MKQILFNSKKKLRKNLWENVKLLNKNGVTIILTTHYLIEAEEMCNRIAILDKGKLAALDTTDNLIGQVKNKKVKFKLDKKVKIENNSLDTMKVISNNGNVLIVSYEKDKLNIDKIIDYLNKKNVKILWASVREVYNLVEAEKIGCHIITVPPSILNKTKNFNKNLENYSQETVQMFFDDAKKSGYSI